ncbi:putative cytochrome P450 [Daldinia sp. FL1419]|nr:putative cytochrome P450 [Daldinia sp. FL1419]
MTIKKFELSGKENRGVATLNVLPSSSLIDLKHDVASAFAIFSHEVISFHDCNGVNIDTIESVLGHGSSIRVKVDGKSIRSPFSPKELPVIGNYLDIYPNHMGNHERLFTRYGSVIKTVNMGTTVYLTNDPRISELILSENEYFTKATSNPSHPLHFMKEETALFWCDSNSPAFEVARKFIPPSISPKATRRYTGNVQEAIEESFCVFDELDKRGKAFHVYQYMVKMASQTIYRICVGSGLGHFRDVDAPLHDIIHDLGDYMALLKRTSLSPLWYKYLPYGDHCRLARVKKRIWAQISNAIDNAGVSGDRGDLPIHEAAMKSTCIADYLKRAVDEHGKKLPKEYMLTNMVVLIGAGFITTASSLSWLVYSLTQYPGNQERLLQELVDSGAMPTRPWTYDEITSLPFLDCFVKETYRMRDPVFQAARNPKTDVIVPGGWLIPANSVIIPTFPAIYQNKYYWDNAHTFNPDRWLDKATNKRRHRLAFTPFGAGPRGCIGYNVALLETKLTIANLVWRYHFENVSKEPVEYDPKFILTRPLNCYIRARRRTSWPEKSMVPEAANDVNSTNSAANGDGNENADAGANSEIV